MSEKILSRKWDVWQERLGWEGNSHLLGKMCPDLSWVKIYWSLLDCQLWSDDGNVQNVLVNFVWQRIVFVSQQVTAPGDDITSGQVRLQDDDNKLSQVPGSVKWIHNICLGGKLIVWSKKSMLVIMKRLNVCWVKRLYGKRPTLASASHNIEIRPRADDKHLILGGV